MVTLLWDWHRCIPRFLYASDSWMVARTYSVASVISIPMSIILPIHKPPGTYTKSEPLLRNCVNGHEDYLLVALFILYHGKLLTAVSDCY